MTLVSTLSTRSFNRRQSTQAVRLLGVVMLLGLSTTVDVAGQERQGRIRFGPLGLTPSLLVTNVGIDTNVFNEAEQPKQDFTAMFSPDVQASLAIGRSRLTGRSGLNLVYFRQYESQRSVGTIDSIRWEIPVNRFRPYVSYSFSEITNRPNLEIDTRVRNRVTGVVVGTEVRLSPRLSAVVEAQRGRTEFKDDARFLGTDLSRTLDRRTENVSGSMRYNLTPVTRFVMTGDFQRELFDFASNRHAKIYGLRPGLEFAPTALLKGTARVGYRKFTLETPAVPDYSGMSASIDLGYVLRNRTRFGIRGDRDTLFSVSDVQPYYLQTGAAFSIAQQLAQTWEANAGISRQWLDYRVATARGGRPPGAGPSLLSRAAQYSYQGGITYRLGRTVRISFLTEYTRRQAGLAGAYKGTRAFGTISYQL